MTMTVAVLLACAACFALKLFGYVLPGRWLEGPKMSRLLGALPVALLAALVVVQTLDGSGGRLALNAVVWALLVAAVLLRLKANFVVVVLAAAIVAAGLRALGLAS